MPLGNVVKKDTQQKSIVTVLFSIARSEILTKEINNSISIEVSESLLAKRPI